MLTIVSKRTAAAVALAALAFGPTAVAAQAPAAAPAASGAQEPAPAAVPPAAAAPALESTSPAVPAATAQPAAAPQAATPSAATPPSAETTPAAAAPSSATDPAATAAAAPPPPASSSAPAASPQTAPGAPAAHSAAPAEAAHAAPAPAATAGAASPPAEPDVPPAAAAASPSAPATSAGATSTAQPSPASPAATAAKPETSPATAAQAPAAAPAGSEPPPATEAKAAPAQADAPSLAPAAAASPATAPSPPAAATAVPAAAPANPQAAAPPPAPPALDPVLAAVRGWLEAPANTGKASGDDVAAAAAFYGERTSDPLWVERTGFNAKARSLIDEMRRADEWGLAASAFDPPTLTDAAPSTEALAAAEAKLTLEALKYARFAKGGRVDPSSLSRILDLVPPVKDPASVLADLSRAAAPDAYLRALHPQHQQFRNLHKALAKARGPAASGVEVDPALKVSLPASKITLKVGVDAPQVALLRQRLKTPAKDGSSETLFDETLALAVKAFQAQAGLKETGQLSGATRQALNREVEAHRAPDRDRDTGLIVLNMERWRWMPEQLGRTYVWNNIPEYMTRVVKNDAEILKERIIVGLPAWATPVFSAEMDHLVFNPSWGMPNGIKVRELQPRLKAAGGGDFFSQLFGGGGGAAASIRAHGLKVYAGNREISPESIDWSKADVRNYSFVQPPGPKNPLGMVKFMFPNKHDVYMHDTIERPLFAQSSRALSHGCIRVQNPERFAAVMLAEGNQLDADGVARARAAGGEVRLKQRIPVHMTYFTAVADADGRVSTYSDIYGHDSRLSSALLGRALRLDPVVEMSSSDVEPAETAPSGSAAKQRKATKKKTTQPADTLADAISGFWLN